MTSSERSRGCNVGDVGHAAARESRIETLIKLAAVRTCISGFIHAGVLPSMLPTQSLARDLGYAVISAKRRLQIQVSGTNSSQIVL